MQELPDYRSRGARALVLLHERRLRGFIEEWRRARDAGVRPPETDDPDCASLEALLRHVLGAARFYVTWVAGNLGLPDPGLRPVPGGPLEDPALDDYLAHLEERWRAALPDALPEAMEAASWPAPWGESFTADAMLEHAVVHPERHGLQLEEWRALER